MRMRTLATALIGAAGLMWLTVNIAAEPQAPKPAAPAAAAAKPAAAPAAKVYKVPRTPDGQPDLQGFWSNATYTPLERPANVGNREFFTPEEFEKVKKDAQARDEEQTTPGTTADVHYDFTQFGLDKSQHTIVQNLRT